ncbi:hypothetical protein [Tissierella sp.]|uniref:hypothetical protein n=1 Tax=Tissierella sp. TaxID=41274 RepID=UPI00285CAD4D|nr:hypothetical protein [Tissierella sp.]MDR7856293.1 hypothetical protein [Tissierella sp.]
MAELTPNYNLEKQQGNDYVNIEGINENFDTIDTTLKQIENSITDLSAEDIKLQDGKTIEEKFTEIEGDIDGKVDNSRVLTDVPENAKFTDTVYSHPTSHPASMITAGTLPGAVVAQANTSYTTAQIRNIILSTADATGTAPNGAVWLKYKP